MKKILTSTVLSIPKEINKGYIALISVILISAIGVAIMVAVISSGINASKTDFSLQQSGSARSMAVSCAEEALQKILETATTSSIGNLTIALGTCSYLIVSSSSIITINASGFLGGVTSKIKVVVSSTSPSITLSSWEEVADF
jgi:hypothetical protein